MSASSRFFVYRLVGIVLLLVLFGALGATNATAQTKFGFAGDTNQFITNYEGFTWSGSTSWVNGTVGPLPGAPSAPLVYAWSNGGANLSMTSSTTFTFNSIALYGDASRWGGTPQSATIEGLLNGSLVDSYTTPVLDTLDALDAFTTFDLNWTGINEVTFSTNNAENLLLTDVTVNEPVVTPEPGSFILMLTGSGLLGFRLVRRKRIARGLLQTT